MASWPENVHMPCRHRRLVLSGYPTRVLLECEFADDVERQWLREAADGRYGRAPLLTMSLYIPVAPSQPACQDRGYHPACPTRAKELEDKRGCGRRGWQ
jgi:hypothetical protein